MPRRGTLAVVAQFVTARAWQFVNAHAWQLLIATRLRTGSARNSLSSSVTVMGWCPRALRVSCQVHGNAWIRLHHASLEYRLDQ